MADATQLHAPERLAEKTVDHLDRLLDLLNADLQTESTVYDGMTRAETVELARRSMDDLWAAAGFVDDYIARRFRTPADFVDGVSLLPSEAPMKVAAIAELARDAAGTVRLTIQDSVDDGVGLDAWLTVDGAREVAARLLATADVAEARAHACCA